MLQRASRKAALIADEPQAEQEIKGGARARGVTGAALQGSLNSKPPYPHARCLYMIMLIEVLKLRGAAEVFVAIGLADRIGVRLDSLLEGCNTLSAPDDLFADRMLEVFEAIPSPTNRSGRTMRARFEASAALVPKTIENPRNIGNYCFRSLGRCCVVPLPAADSDTFQTDLCPE